MPTVLELKKVCKDNGIKGYSKLNKHDLLKTCVSRKPSSRVEPLPRQETVAQLKQMCREKQIKGYSKLPKARLLSLCKGPSVNHERPIAIQYQHGLTPTDYSKQLAKLKRQAARKFYNAKFSLGSKLKVLDFINMKNIACVRGDIFIKLTQCSSMIKCDNYSIVPSNGLLPCEKTKRLHIWSVGMQWDTFAAHANLIVIDNVLKTYERFEPHGIVPLLFIKEKSLNDVFDSLEFRENSGIPSNFKYIAPKDFCPRVGPQNKTVKLLKKLLGFTGLCQFWTLYYMRKRIENPEKTNKDVIREFFSVRNDILTKEILKFVMELTKEKQIINPLLQKSN